MPHVVDGPHVSFRAVESSLYHVYVTLLGCPHTHVSSSNLKNMLTLTSGPISSSQILLLLLLPMPRARCTPRTTVLRFVCLILTPVPDSLPQPSR